MKVRELAIQNWRKLEDKTKTIYLTLSYFWKTSRELEPLKGIPQAPNYLPESTAELDSLERFWTAELGKVYDLQNTALNASVSNIFLDYWKKCEQQIKVILKWIECFREFNSGPTLEEVD